MVRQKKVKNKYKKNSSILLISNENCIFICQITVDVQLMALFLLGNLTFLVALLVGIGIS